MDRLAKSKKDAANKMQLREINHYSNAKPDQSFPRVFEEAVELFLGVVALFVAV